MYYSWESQEKFDIWHEEVKISLGIPYPNKNFNTGETNEDASWTTSYTVLLTDDEGVLFAKVSDEIAASNQENIGTPYQPVFYQEPDF